MLYLSLAVAPVLIILVYIYVRDKYNKEPIWLLLLLFFAGMFSVIPVLITGYFTELLSGYFQGLYKSAYHAFVQAALVEEFFKLFFVFVIVWWNKHFDERFDGIVYAVFVSMGFALVENILYVFDYGATTGLIRIFTAVPAHAIFAISMGYYLGRAKFDANRRALYLLLAFIVPVLLHGFYDFVLMAGLPWLLLVFVVYLIFMYIYGFRHLKILAKYKVKPVEVNNTEFSNIEQNNGVSFNSEQGSDQNKGFNMGTPITDNNTNQQFTTTNQQQTYVQGQQPYQNQNTFPPNNNLNTISIFHYVWGGITLFASLFLLIYVVMGLFMIIAGTSENQGDMTMSGGALFIIGLLGFVLVAAIGVLSILCGRYLQKKKNRVFCIVISALTCLNAPLGTMLGIFTIIELEKTEVKALFETNKEKQDE